MRRKNKRHDTKAASPEKSPEKASRRSSRHSRRRRNASSSPEREEDDKAAAAAATATATVVKELKQTRSSSPSPVLVTEPAEATTENKEKGDGAGAVWKVQSANGAGGEIQKLKICRSFLSKEISSPKRRGRSHRDSSQKGTEESSDCDDHSQSEGSESKSRHRTRTRTVSQSSPTLQDSPKVVCDVSDEKPTKIKIHIGSKSPVATPPDVTVAMVEQVVEEEVIVDSQQVEEVATETVQEVAQVPNDTEQEAQQTSDDTTLKASTEVVVDVQSIQNIELPAEAAPVEKPNSHTSSPRAEKKQATVNEDRTTEDSDSGTNSDDDHTDDETNVKKKKKKRRKKGMMSSVSRQKPIPESDQPQRRESSKEEPGEERIAQEEEGARTTAEEQHRDHEESAKETSSVTVDKENVAESSRTSPAPAEPVAKKRRWGASKSIRPAKKPVLCISTDSLKNLIPEAKPVSIEEVRLSVEEENEHIEDMEEDQSEVKKESPKEVKKKDRKKEKERLKEKEEEELDEKPDRDEKPERPSTDGMKVNRRICVLSEDDRKLARSPSPPRHRPSDVLFITNLVRPFTIPQLKNLLARTGKIAENGFWIDKIKSKCYVQYSDVEEAIETRHALHGVRWPVSNPRTLCVEFANHDDMVVAQAAAEQEAIPRKTEPLFHSGGDHSVEGWIADQARLNSDRPQRRVREWDVGKPAHPDEALDQLHTPRPDFEDPRDRERRVKKEKGRRSRTPDAHQPIARKQRRKDEDAPAKLLDDLFRKTKVHPCIYWLPLTAEQIVVKEEMRRQHMAEHERRIAEMKKAEQSRRDRDRRDRSRK
ncbi:apoptotic chromatin condensation inducer in the nucleus isoform X2 [Nilaparvata lugens]|uniref:apoptotic chromatin condensation inducer in the nucleus isoform X2 n=1 Tax=Nilaparvata lugens TaxID=108931 RepID=UPI00193EAD84|nr:apoptotic chromatin condensation inducer in the nucleus isoform X2 [Nilaparvata lugens]